MRGQRTEITPKQRKLLIRYLTGNITAKKARMKLGLHSVYFANLQSKYFAEVGMGKIRQLIRYPSEAEMLQNATVYNGSRYEVRKAFWKKLCGGL